MRRRRHYRRNPITTDTEIVVGGLVGLSILGIGGYLLYKHFNPTSATSSSSNSLTAAQQAGYVNPGGTVTTGTDANGNPTINGYPVLSGG